MKSSIRKKPKNGVASFVEKLSKMLDTPEYQDVISWSDDGASFQIKSVTKLTQVVLPIFFKHQNFSSFIRQLNMYNFTKIRQAQGDNVYSNQHFRRNSKNEYKNIKRRTADEKDEMLLYQVNNNHALTRQLNEMARKQKELESVIQDLVTDNQSLRAENTKLWKRVEKNIEKSDKKIEKLLLFMLFGGQNPQGEEHAMDLSMIEDNSQEVRQQIQMDPQQKTPKQALASNLFSMLNKNNSSMQLKNLMKGFSKQTKSKKRRNHNEVEPFSDPTLSIKNHGEHDQQEQILPLLSPSPHNFPSPKPIIDDVNLFLNVQQPGLPDNQFPLI